jgi:hypothetical protein
VEEKKLKQNNNDVARTASGILICCDVGFSASDGREHENSLKIKKAIKTKTATRSQQS